MLGETLAGIIIELLAGPAVRMLLVNVSTGVITVVEDPDVSCPFAVL